MPSTSVTLQSEAENGWVLSLVFNDRRQLDDVTFDDVTVPSFFCGDGERSVADRREPCRRYNQCQGLMMNNDDVVNQEVQRSMVHE